MSVVEVEAFHSEEFAPEGLLSPFAAGARVFEAEQPDVAMQHIAAGGSPFAEGFALASEAEFEREAAAYLAAELEDEEFDEALEALVDEASARHLQSAASWSSESEAASLATNEVEAWLGELASEAVQLFEQLEQTYEGRAIDSLGEHELELFGQTYLEHRGLEAVSEQFLGGLIKKAGKLVKGVVKVIGKGLSAVGKLLPVGKLFALLSKLVKPLLRRVLQRAVGMLPVALRGPASDLAKRLTGESTAFGAGEQEAFEDESEGFDRALAEVALAGSEASAESILAELEAESATPASEAVGALDATRAKLARELIDARPGEAPTAQLEQFIPVVMAAMPLIRSG